MTRNDALRIAGHALDATLERIEAIQEEMAYEAFRDQARDLNAADRRVLARAFAEEFSIDVKVFV